MSLLCDQLQKKDTLSLLLALPRNNDKKAHQKKKKRIKYCRNRGHQANAAQRSLGLRIAEQSQAIIIGPRPQVLPKALQHSQKVVINLLHCASRCSAQFSFLLSIIPRSSLIGLLGVCQIRLKIFNRISGTHEYFSSFLDLN